MTTPIPPERVEDELIDAMLSGLEGVTPGPWVYGSKFLGAYVDGDTTQYLRIARDGAEDSYDGDLWNANAAHIARCDPDTMRSILTELKALRASHADAGGEVEVEWVVNDIAELGVKIGHQFFFLYKGTSITYTAEDGGGFALHDDDKPMHWRHVFKREFGECAHPINRDDPKLIGTVSLSDSDDWQKLPAANEIDAKLKFAALTPTEPAVGSEGEAKEYSFPVMVDDDTRPEDGYLREDWVTVPREVVAQIVADAAPVAPRVGMVVKKLEWVEVVTDTWWIADAYRIEPFDGGGFAARMSDPQSRAFKTLSYGVPFARAKAVCDEHYEARILAALEPNNG